MVFAKDGKDGATGRPAGPLNWIIGILAATCLVAPADGGELSFAIGHPPQSYVVLGGNAFADALKRETNGAVTARVFSMSLLSMMETSSGLREGLADVGTVMNPYHAAEYPHVNLIHDASMVLEGFTGLTRNLQGVAYAGAMAEFVLMRCPECNAEFARQNQVYTGAAATTPYTLNCTRPIRTLDDFRGARLRIGGSNWARWAAALNATPVTLSGDEMLEALSQGILDCILLDIPDVKNFGLSGTLSHITTDVPGGVFVVAFANVNRDVWHGLSSAQRVAFMKSVAHGTAVTNWAFRQGEVEALSQANAGGRAVHNAAAEVRAATTRFIRSDLDNLAGIYAARGVIRGTEMLDEFFTLLGKWAALVSNVASQEDLERIYWTEIYSKVNVDRHGF